MSSCAILSLSILKRVGDVFLTLGPFFSNHLPQSDSSLEKKIRKTDIQLTGKNRQQTQSMNYHGYLRNQMSYFCCYNTPFWWKYYHFLISLVFPWRVLFHTHIHICEEIWGSYNSKAFYIFKVQFFKENKILKLHDFDLSHSWNVLLISLTTMPIDFI